MSGMSSSRPYLVRALFDWIVDNGLTPHLLVNAVHPGTEVPTEFVENGKIVLNISPTATEALDLGNEVVMFNARFGGQPMTITVPVNAILAIYARENGQGMLFGEDDGQVPDPEGGAPAGEGDGDDEPPQPPSGGGGGPHLKVVK